MHKLNELRALAVITHPRGGKSSDQEIRHCPQVPDAEGGPLRMPIVCLPKLIRSIPVHYRDADACRLTRVFYLEKRRLAVGLFQVGSE